MGSIKHIILVLSLFFTNALLADIFTVTNPNGNVWWPANGDPGSLQRAITDAAANPGRDTIQFAVPGDVVSSAKDPLEIASGQGDLFIDGISTLTSNSVTINFSFDVGATDVEFYGLNFQTTNSSIEITGDNNTVDSCSFAVTGGGQNGVWIRGGNNSTVKNCLFTASQQHAVSVEVGGGHTIVDCVADGIKDVAFITRGTGGNSFSNCIARNGNHNGFGMLSPNNIIEDCQAYNNARSGIAVDNSIGTGSGNIIRRNTVYGNNTNFYMGTGNPLYDQGAIFSNGPSTEIYDNYIYDNDANGIMIDGAFASNTIIRDNIIGRDALGDELGNGWNGISIHTAGGSTIEGNTIVNNGSGSSHGTYYMPDRVSGIRLEAVSSGTIENNYIGTDASKTEAGNAFDGITVYTNSSGVVINDNVSCYNGFYDFDGLTTHSGWNGTPGGGGIAFRTGSGSSTITSNFIGVHRDNTDGGNKDYGISVEGGANITIGGSNIDDGNVIGYSENAALSGTTRGCGIWLVLAASSNNTVYNNSIINNNGSGICIEQSASNNILGASGQGNTITGNGEFGIFVNSSANQNTLRYNSFSCNAEGGISLQSSGNSEYGNGGDPKEVLINSNEARSNFVSGYAPSANAVVDIYAQDSNCPLECSDSVNQGFTMVASVNAASSASTNGLYFWEYDFVAGGNLVDKSNVIVLATENGVAGQVNTSEFSVCNLTCDTPMNAMINSADFQLCPSENTTLEANAIGMSSNGYKYDWYLESIDPGNLIHSAVDDSVYTTSQAGDYYVIISFVSDPAACSDTTPVAVVVSNSNPTIDLTPSETALCEGGDLTIDAGVSGANIEYLWTPNNEVVQEITVTQSGTYGVTVTNTSTGCSSNDDILISENSLPAVSAQDVQFCQGDSVLISAGIEGLDYVWSPSGETSSSFYVYASGEHRVAVTDPSTGCTAYDTLQADQSPEAKPVVTLPEDSVMCPTEGDVIVINAAVSSNLTGTLTWSDGTVGIDSIVATDTTIYWAEYIDSYNCSDRDTMKIAGECIPPDPELPNVISEQSPWRPIGDITPEQVQGGTLFVYDRWGLLMYESNEKLPEWTGLNMKEQQCSSGVYYWIWEFTDNTNEFRRYNGFVQLLK